MTFAVQCPNCSNSLKATDKHIGRRAKCPKCGASVTIARLHEDAAPEAPTPVPPILAFTEPVVASRNQKRTFSLPVFVGTAISALLAGYFVGREHIKYEMRSALIQAGEAFKEGLQEAFNVDPEPHVDQEAEAFEKQPLMTMGKIHAAEVFSIALVDARIDHAEVKSSFGNDPIETDEKYLLLTFRVTNTDDRKIIHFRDSGSFGASDFSLVDDVKNQIRGVGFGYSSELIGAISITDDIQPGENRTHLEVFTIPPPKTQYLMLTVNLKAFDGEGRIKYQIPANEIKGFGENPP
jgi:hypothetical protein